MTYKVIQCRGVISFFICAVGSLTITEWGLTRLDNSSYGAERLGSSRTSGSIIQCAWFCRMSFSARCQSIMYNTRTTLCTPTSFVMNSSSSSPGNGTSPPTSAEGNLYTSVTCDTRNGFELLASTYSSACVFVSNETKNYEDAKEECARLGSFMFSATSMAKIELLPIAPPLYIGLTDIEVEGTFAWDYDGEPISTEFKSKLFSPGEPNDFDGNEDCTNLNYHTPHVANDVPCVQQLNFVCERPVLSP